MKNCRGCVLCRKSCRFLQTYGTPGTIREQYRTDPEKWQLAAFHCSLCRRCTAVCPRGFDPCRMFLHFREQAVAHDRIDFRAYRPLLTYERLGMSRAFTFYHVPKKHAPVFFPGCALAGTRPGLVIKTFAALRQQIPDLGIVLDCCIKPSHDLGRRAFFEKAFQRLANRLKRKKVSEIIVTCPSCHALFKQYAGPVSVRSAYELIRPTAGDGRIGMDAEFCIHDACQTRFESPVQEGARRLLDARGIKAAELKASKTNTLCCGEGGGVGFVSPFFARSWTDQRLRGFNNKTAICYCAGCTALFSQKTDAVHLLDLVFDSQTLKNGLPETPRPPVTYLNRLALKCRLAFMLGLKHTDLF